MEDKQFIEQITDAYEHIYDLVYLRTHPLLERLPTEKNASRKDRAWQLHHLLLDVIREFDPGPNAPAFSREWRRHRLMVLRYVDGLTPQAVADELAISRRHFYREHESALEALAHILYLRYYASPQEEHQANTSAELNPPEGVDTPLDRMELLRLEAAQLAQIERRTNLPDVLQKVIALLANQAQQRAVIITYDRDAELPDTWGDRRLIRHLLLGLLGHLIKVSEHGTIELTVQVDQQNVRLTIAIASKQAIIGSIEADPKTPLSVLEELANLSGVQLAPLTDGETVTGYTIALPLYHSGRTVLVIDDNEDILEMFQRYLNADYFNVVALRDSKNAVEQARLLKPFVIVLDLMMPDQDGWDLLQILLNQPETRTIPIVICSVLRQKELALSLGATAFIEKPISEARLLSILNKLKTNR